MSDPRQEALAVRNFISLELLLTGVLSGLEQRGFRACILRNHERLPHDNVGNDIDLLTDCADLPILIDVVRAVPGAVVTSFARRSYVNHVFVYGVLWGAGRRAIQLDFISGLVWKGVPYVDTAGILQRTKALDPSYPVMQVPTQADRAVTSLLSSLVSAGVVKERYFAEVRRVLQAESVAAAAALAVLLGDDADDFIAQVVCGSTAILRSRIVSIRRRLVGRALLHRPFVTMAAVTQYYLREIVLRLDPALVSRIRITSGTQEERLRLARALHANLRDTAKEMRLVPGSRRTADMPPDEHAALPDPQGPLTHCSSLVLDWRPGLDPPKSPPGQRLVSWLAGRKRAGRVACYLRVGGQSVEDATEQVVRMMQQQTLARLARQGHLCVGTR